MSTTQFAVEATITTDPEVGLIVRSSFPNAGVDRPEGLGFVVTNRAIGDRLCRAMRAGAVFVVEGIATDVNGHTYVDARSLVLGRKMNADLTRLGF